MLPADFPRDRGVYTYWCPFGCRSFCMAESVHLAEQRMNYHLDRAHNVYLVPTYEHEQKVIFMRTP